ncbi:MAG TPA: hypothetical protein VHY91_22885 [Pirellulales bacterium]|jgi:hypothetical protein|nr:hypothetical protein [Pirellulales bacterium]
MNTARVIQALKTPRAVLACLCWALLLGAARADDGLQPLRDASSQTNTSTQALDGPISVSADDLADEPLPPGNALPAPETEEVQPEGKLKLIEWPSFGSARQQMTRVAACRWIPRGMIPFGPRTPDSEKDIGIGLPLVGNGWRSQPFSITAFSGFTDGGPLIPGHLNQQPSYYGGLNFGWDYDHHWGVEKRLGFGALNLTNGQNQPIPRTGLSVTGEYRLMYYPLGDARFRPFLTAGVGWSDFYFNDDRGASHLDTLGMIPFGVGLKYLCTERLALRVDLIDEMTFGGGVLSNFHYAALTLGLEVRYGKRLINMPWHRNDGS